MADVMRDAVLHWQVEDDFAVAQDVVDAQRAAARDAYRAARAARAMAIVVRDPRGAAVRRRVRHARCEAARRARVLVALRELDGIVEHVCPSCGGVFVVESHTRNAAVREYCSRRCAVVARVRRFRARVAAALT